eukprot:5891858-Pleurochrysis_carterae.AAC.4
MSGRSVSSGAESERKNPQARTRLQASSRTHPALARDQLHASACVHLVSRNYTRSNERSHTQ